MMDSDKEKELGAAGPPGQPIITSHQAADATTEGGRPETYVSSTMSLRREVVFVLTVCSAQLTTQAGMAQAAGTMHIIGDWYGLSSPGDLAWFMAAYSLSVGTFILVSGRFGDLFGHKKMVVIGYVWFALWSLVAGCAAFTSHFLFNVARALQGIGPAILLPNALAILGSSYPPGTRKNMVFAIFGAMAPSGGCLGHTFGVLFALAWWPWAYWALALLLVGLAVLSAVVVPSQPVEAPVRLDFRAKVRELDLAGAVVGITALVLINVAWNQAPSAGWSTPHVYLLLLLGLLLLPVFFYVELRLAPKPLLPLQALRSPELGFVLGCIACGWSCFGIWYYYLWQFYLTVRQVPPLLGAAYFAPAPVAGALASLATGRMLGRVGPAWTMVCALTAFLAGICLEATLPAQQTYWANGFLTAVVMPFGMDMSFPAATVLLSNAVPRRHQGIAASLVNTVVNYSISLALGCAGTAEAYVAAGRDATPEDRLRGYRAAWYVGIGIAGLGWALSLVFVLYRSRARTRSRKAVAAAAEAAEGSDSSK